MKEEEDEEAEVSNMVQDAHEFAQFDQQQKQEGGDEVMAIEDEDEAPAAAEGLLFSFLSACFFFLSQFGYFHALTLLFLSLLLLQKARSRRRRRATRR